MRFLPHTDEDVRTMLAAVGLSSLADLFSAVPAELRESARIDLPPGLSESSLTGVVDRLAAGNDGAFQPAFLGAGAYPHFVPAVVDQVLSRAEFYSAYTPYQPEVSQGTLQAIFEFQTLVAGLFDLEVANASMYDGASATAEAVLMALRVRRKRSRVVLARSLHPEYRAVTATYLEGSGAVDVVEAPFSDDGRIDMTVLRELLTPQTAAVVAGYPNFFGVLEDLPALARLAHDVGALLLTATPEPLALAVARAPGSSGADIAVGEGQSFGIPVQYGGPGVGLFATRLEHVRSMPGRLVGETVDGDGRRGYVLTLATREQHIRREKATSNICTNHGLTALAATVYLCLMGKQGLRRLAVQNLRRAHDLRRRLCAGGRWEPAFGGPIFNEFTIRGADVRGALARAEEAGILAGLPLGRWMPELDDCLLLAVTEVQEEADVDRLVEVLR